MPEGCKCASGSSIKMSWFLRCSCLLSIESDKIIDKKCRAPSLLPFIGRLGSSYTAENVLTIRDVVGSVVDGGTIEDMLGKNYVESRFKTLYKEYFAVPDCDIEFNESEASVEQIKVYLLTNGRTDDIDKFLEALKDKLASDFNPAKDSFATNFPLLDSLGTEIIAKMES